MAIYRGDGGANEATDLATNQAAIAKEYAEQAATSATEAAQVLDEFSDVYLGPFMTEPTLDNDGQALQLGALYFDTSDQFLKIWNGTSWLVSAVSEPSSFARNTFSGNGSQTVFVLSTTPVNNDSVFVFVGGVITTAYNVTGTNLTFTSAPASGTNNILAIVASTVSVGTPSNNSISTDKLQEGAVTTSKVGDLQITAPKLDTNSVTTSKIADGAVSVTKILDGAITTAKISNNQISTAKIINEAVTGAKLETIGSAGSAGSTSKIPVVSIDTKGRVTALSEADVTPPIPAGMIFPYAGTSAPAGYLLVPTTPTLVSRTTYATLFAAIGTTWGVGDGSTTFGLPYIPANHVPVQANGNVGTATVGEVISHSHEQRYSDGVAGNLPGTKNILGALPSGSFTGTTGGSANLAAGVRTLFIIKT